MDKLIAQAAEAVRSAEALLICAGAGMGVDSGLPDFRGNQGFWKAYPPFARLGLGFMDMANPQWFQRDPELAWGFYGHRQNLYRATVPHEGFQILRRWAARMDAGAFVFTSNVDGQFQKAGFAPDAVEECHGSIHHMQCAEPCHQGIWPADAVQVTVDEETMRGVPPLPTCPRCGELARPNILMFGDWAWVARRSTEQGEAMAAFARRTAERRLVIVECGAGTAVPTVRWVAERAARSEGATLIRINVREPQVPPGGIGLALGALQALSEIDATL